MTTLLPYVSTPQDLRALPAELLPGLAREIREFLVDKVSARGGHLGSNLGVVELTITLHREFVAHGSRAGLLAEAGLTGQGIAHTVGRELGRWPL